MTNPEIITPLGLAAAELHEVFLAFQEAGFTEEQALSLCGEVLRGAGNGET